MHTALSLIGYETDLEKAMQYVFGASFVCKDMNSAKRVTFDEGVMKKSVTLEGDSFDPAGTLTGGRKISHENSRNPTQTRLILTAKGRQGTKAKP